MALSRARLPATRRLQKTNAWQEQQGETTPEISRNGISLGHHFSSFTLLSGLSGGLSDVTAGSMAAPSANALDFHFQTRCGNIMKHYETLLYSFLRIQRWCLAVSAWCLHLFSEWATEEIVRWDSIASRAACDWEQHPSAAHISGMVWVNAGIGPEILQRNFPGDKEFCEILSNEESMKDTVWNDLVPTQHSTNGPAPTKGGIRPDLGKSQIALKQARLQQVSGLKNT